MVNYQNGKIYKIESNIGDMVYYGSTTKQYLSQRMDTHRGHYKHWLNGDGNFTTSFKLFEEYGIKNCQIILVESYSCNNKDELKTREAHYIKNFECVNKCVPNRTSKEWRQDNKETIKEYMDEYRHVNNDKITKQQKKYYESNKESINIKHKEWVDINREKVRDYDKKRYDNLLKEKFTCECGAILSKGAKFKHVKRRQHLKYMDNNIILELK